MKRKIKTIEEILLEEYVSQTELGVLFGTSSHWIGRWLAKLGYWVPCGQPTAKAYLEDLVNPLKRRWYAPVDSKEYDCDRNYSLNTWHLRNTVAVLVAAGHPLKAFDQPGPTKAVSKYVV